MTDWLPKCDSLSFDKAKRGFWECKNIYFYLCVCGGQYECVSVSLCVYHKCAGVL